MLSNYPTWFHQCQWTTEEISPSTSPQKLYFINLIFRPCAWQFVHRVTSVHLMFDGKAWAVGIRIKYTKRGTGPDICRYFSCPEIQNSIVPENSQTVPDTFIFFTHTAASESATHLFAFGSFPRAYLLVFNSTSHQGLILFTLASPYTLRQILENLSSFLIFLTSSLLATLSAALVLNTW